MVVRGGGHVIWGSWRHHPQKQLPTYGLFSAPEYKEPSVPVPPTL